MKSRVNCGHSFSMQYISLVTFQAWIKSQPSRSGPGPSPELRREVQTPLLPGGREALKPLSSLGQCTSRTRKCPPRARARSFRVNSAPSPRSRNLGGGSDLEVELSVSLGQV